MMDWCVKGVIVQIEKSTCTSSSMAIRQQPELSLLAALEGGIVLFISSYSAHHIRDGISSFLRI